LRNAERNVEGVQNVPGGLNCIGGLRRILTHEGRAHEPGRWRIVAGNADGSAALAQRRDVRRTDLRGSARPRWIQ